jgi:uncharacterized protein DUF2568
MVTGEPSGDPAVAAVLWGLLAAPRARIRLPLAGVLAVKAVLFAGTAAAVYSLGQPGLAIAFAVVAFAKTAVAGVDRDARTRAGASQGAL